MRVTRFILIACGLAAALANAACQQRRETIDERTPFSLVSESEWTFSTHPSLALGATDLRELAGRALQNSGRFVPLGGSGDESSVRSPLVARAFAEVLSAEVTPTTENNVSVDVRVRFQLVPPLSDDPAGIVAVGAGAAKGLTGDASRTAVLLAMGHALEQIAAEQHGQARGNAELVADLTSSDPTHVDVALGRLAARRHPASFAPLVARLRSPDIDVAQQAVAFLVSLNDPRAVRPIIEEAEQRSLTFRIEALYALGSLGGDEAEAYLFTLTSDPDVRVRNVASEALSLAKRRGVVKTNVRPAEPVR